ncbi:MAG: TonB-dependent receptor [Balneola sp.]|nr:MAG: TonB-dependent receptor [Balneola sp.]
MKKALLTIGFLSLISFSLFAQPITISGRVVDGVGEPLSSASVTIKGTLRGTLTDSEGYYNINASRGDILIFSFVGFKAKEALVEDNPTINMTLDEQLDLGEVLVVGSRNKSRTVLETAVPIDVLDVSELLAESPQVNLNQLMNYVLPSFSSSPQIVADGTDHIDPASLRGLGPDQMLILINGKRRHTSALLNVNGTPGRGSVGTDLNAIPAAAIERIEVLRDGAAAQYGSDAIAGVINIVLKKETDNLDISVQTGAQTSANGNNFDGGVDGEDFQLNINRGLAIGDQGGFINVTGSINTRNRTSRSGEFTGEIFNGYNAIEWVAYQDGANLQTLQTDLASIQQYAAGVTHFSTDLKNSIAAASDIATVQALLSDSDGNPVDYSDAELEARGLDRGDFRMNIGQPEYREGKLFANFELPIGESTLYSFAGISNRRSVGFAFYRRPTQERAYTPLEINGFRPEGHTFVKDRSFAVGIRQNIAGWDTDLSTTIGANTFKFWAANSLNATLQGASPNLFDSWNTFFQQTTSNFDVTRNWPDTFAGLNVAFGAEYRIENYRILEGEEASWATYDIDGNVVADFNQLADSLKVVDFFGRPRVGGAQAFPGFSPSNAVDDYRQSFAGYVDFEFDFTDNFLVGTALRYENYSDFGSTLNFKLASRLSFNEAISVRASTSTGFRAPSLHQLNFSSISTQFDSEGIGQQVLTARNTSTVVQNLGVPQLKEETSLSVSGGFTLLLLDLGITLSVDGYYTGIEDRIVLTNQFSQDDFIANGDDDIASILEGARANKIQFFTNAIDTETMGIEAVASHQTNVLGNWRLTNDFAFSYSQTKRVGDINTSDLLADYEEIYFDGFSGVLLEEAIPQTKMNLATAISNRNWTFLLRNAYFGDVKEAETYEVNGVDVHPVYSGKVITDLSAIYRYSPQLSFTVGANNLLDIYPDRRPDDLTSGNQFIYSRRIAQFGSNGRYVFTKVTVGL